MRLKAPPHKHKPHSKKVKVNEPLILRSSRVVCSAKNILFSSVYAIKSIIMPSFANGRAYSYSKCLTRVDVAGFRASSELEWCKRFVPST